jgi:hypothetical protein
VNDKRAPCENQDAALGDVEIGRWMVQAETAGVQQCGFFARHGINLLNQ